MTASRDPTSSWPDELLWRGLPPIVRGIARVAWRLDVRGEAFPEPPYVVASNHHSFLDPLLLGAVVGRKTRFIALVDLFGNYRWLDYALARFDVIPVRRGVVPLGPVRAALSHLDHGVVGLFPEGTRHDRFDPTRIRRGAGWLAARAGVPLVPVAISGTEEVLGVDNRLGLGRIRVEIGPGLETYGADHGAIEDLNRRWSAWVAGRVQ